jgi:GrpB-like predicted nucleotidyltransferase (UPF0157 family)
MGQSLGHSAAMSLTSEICDYDPQWPALFEAERRRIQQKLGQVVLEIHHVGSTAVPGMKAKPEIDLLIVVKSITNIDPINLGMTELGYDVRGECGIEGRHYYSKNIQSARTHKAHVCEISHSNVARQIAFRDYMRDHPKDAKEYAALKMELAQSNSRGMAEYREGKQNYIEGIIYKALSEGYGRLSG